MAAAFQHVSPIVVETCEGMSSIRSVEDLEDAFGVPLEHESHPMPNRHVKDQIDEWHTATFADAEAGYLVSETATRPIMVYHLRIHTKRSAFGAYQLIGKPAANALTLLGPPDAEAGNDLIYYCGEVNSIRLEVVDGGVSAIIWQPYAG